MILGALAAGAAVISFFYLLVGLTASPPGIPRVGAPGLIGYIRTALVYTVNAEKLINEGSAEFRGRPFAVPTLAGWLILLGPEHVEQLRASNDSIINQPIAVNENLQLDHTMNPGQQGNPFQAAVVRTEVTRAITSFIPEVLDETQLAMEDTFNPDKDAKPIHVPVFNTMTHMIARISNRAVLGTGLCRNPGFIDAIVHFAETLVLYAHFLRWMPKFLRPTAYFLLSSMFGGQEQPKKFIVPYITNRMEERELTDPEDGPNNIAEFLIRRAPPTETGEGLAMRVMNLNFGSIHTSSIFLTQALFDLAALPQSDLEQTREETRHALESEGGWTKAALSKFRKIDSVLKEVGRVYGLGLTGLPRLMLQDGKLLDGTIIPKGYTLSVDMRAVHFNPEVYSNPEVFDPFRFSKLREEEESDIKHGFTTLDNNYLVFGAGRHACPGRFFAAMELKIMLGYLLLHYDFFYPPEKTERPPNTIFNGTTLPNTKAVLVFKAKSDLHLDGNS